MYANTHVDYALTAMGLFVGFFFFLIVYLRREDRREGYPLEEDSGRLQPAGGVLTYAPPKTFILPHGRGTRQAPDFIRDSRALAARQSVVPGSPIVPTGNPFADGLGSAAYAQRPDYPEATAHGDPKIVPLRILPEGRIALGDKDPRGMAVVGCDGVRAGVVDELWIDRSEIIVRYLSVRLEASGTSVLLPLAQAVIRNARNTVQVDAITAAQFAGVPPTAAPDQVTMLEEEMIVAYFGGGYLYATPARSEPVL